MVTVIVKYKTPKRFAREEIAATLQRGAEHMFKDLPHLYSKQFCFDVVTSEGVSVYLWDTRENAEAFFNDAFLESFQQGMGAVPAVEYYETILSVDNRMGDILMGES